ncbi:hypothetical protein CDAR_103851 [Caerostris darwini]|uniref:Uncharacterized protein n=1 Tax=Caerostris darwini TaxID=1538125 RepID=A0AAV4M863_9ARAC|nr:hypothetical protein CDAR_103851 [Caerostris darwini]
MTGDLFPVQALLHSGSASCFLTKECADTLQLKKEKKNVAVTGLSGCQFTIKSRVAVSINNKERSFPRELDFLVVPKITEDLIPSSKIEISEDDLMFLSAFKCYY